MKPRKQISEFSNRRLPLYILKEQLDNILTDNIWYALTVQLSKETDFLYENQKNNLL